MMPERKKRSSPKPLTQDQQDFVRKNSAKLCLYQLHCITGGTDTQIKKFIKNENLRKFQRSSKRAVVAPVEVLIKHKPIKPDHRTEPFVRPPAEYSNPDWSKKYID